MSKNSFVCGSATVYFGGAIRVGAGYDKDRDIAGITFREFKSEMGIGSKVDKSTPSYENGVSLVFNDIRSIEQVRRALDLCEYGLKNKELTEEIVNKLNP